MSKQKGKGGDSVGNVQVVCRFRPLNEKEKKMGRNLCMNILDDKTVEVLTDEGKEEKVKHKFSLDRIFPCETTQQQLYEVAAQPIVVSILEGFNGTVFCYGQTSSGKTFSMQGPDVYDPEMKGIIPRMINTLFKSIDEAPDSIEFQIKVGYCEIYLEKIKDLLCPKNADLKVKEDKNHGIYIDGQRLEYVGSEIEVFDYMIFGQGNREVGFTNMNAGSSRSHSLFMMHVQSNDTKTLAQKSAKLYLIDLAGSEKVGKTGAEGKRLDEAKNINKSLTALGMVINALTDGKQSHIPYRDSKLTRVLQDSLGGNSKTSLIVTASPSPYNDAETLSTLRFGVRAKSIKNQPKVNKEMSVAEMKLLLDQAEKKIVERDNKIKKLVNRLKRFSNISISQLDNSELYTSAFLEGDLAPDKEPMEKGDPESKLIQLSQPPSHKQSENDQSQVQQQNEQTSQQPAQMEDAETNPSVSNPANEIKMQIDIEETQATQSTQLTVTTPSSTEPPSSKATVFPQVPAETAPSDQKQLAVPKKHAENSDDSDVDLSDDESSVSKAESEKSDDSQASGNIDHILEENPELEEQIRLEFENIQEQLTIAKATTEAESERADQCQKELTAIKARYELLERENDSLMTRIQTLNVTIEENEDQLDEKDATIAQLVTEKAHMQAEIEDLMLRIHQDIEQSIIVEELQQLVNVATQTTIEINFQEEDYEKQILIQNLERRVRKVVDLEIELHELREKYEDLQKQTLVPERPDLQNKVDLLEKKCQKLTNLYNQQLKKISENEIKTKVMNLINLYKGKLERKEEKLRKVSQQAQENLQLAKEWKEKAETIESQFTAMQQSMQQVVGIASQAQGRNVIKRVKGGQASRSQNANSQLDISTSFTMRNLNK